MKTFVKIGKWIIIILAAIIVIGLVAAAFSDGETDKEPETLSTNTTEPSVEPSVEPSANSTDGFEVEHDEEYLETRQMIWDFLIEKGYDVETIVGVPNIGKTDADLGENYEGWYAYIEKDGEYKEFSVVLFNGEVSAIQPVS